MAEKTKKVTWHGPVAGEDCCSAWHTWSTKDGAYQVRRSVNATGLGGRFMVGYRRHVVRHDRTEYDLVDFVRDERTQAYYPKEYRTLAAAFEAAERLLSEREVVTIDGSNAAAVTAKAAAAGLAKFASKEDSAPERVAPATMKNNDAQKEEGETMSAATTEVLNVTRGELVDLLTGLGFLTDSRRRRKAERWDAERCVRKVKDLPAFMKKQPDRADRIAKLSAPQKELLGNVCAAVEADVEIKVRAEAAPKAKAGAKSNGKAVGKSAAKKAAKPPSSNGAAANVDAWGFREGTRKAQIMQILAKAKKPLTVPQIREAGSIPGGYQDFLDALAKDGTVKGDHKDGWTLAKKSRG
jgi:hypothetical protein